jgi:CRISPR/Cas system CSM-associated protein Csm3 (group 7 of RAMP superfamily)
MTYTRRPGPPPAPKPYEFVAPPADRQPERRAPIGHDAIRPNLLTGRIELAIEALSPVHVASGLRMLTNEARRPLVRELVRVGGVPVVPGSSLKGCVRAVVEASSRSCFRATRARELPLGFEGCRSKDNLCVACRMFGAQDFQGLLRFGDMTLKGDPHAGVEIATVPQFFQPRTRELTYLEKGPRGAIVRGRKFYMHGARQASGDGPIEVCKAGSRFKGALDFANLDRAQLGLVLIALGQDPKHPFALKLGGAKPACYGSVRVHITTIALSDRTRFLEWDAPADAAGDLGLYVDTAHSILVLGDQLDALAEVLKWPNERVCPAGNY